MLLTSVRCHITASHYKKYRCRYTLKYQKIALFKTNQQIKLASIRVPFFCDNSLIFFYGALHIYKHEKTSQ